MTRINIKGGEFSYGQRIELGMIFNTSGCDDFTRLCRSIECLHGQKPESRDFSDLIDYYEEIIEGLTFWIEQENTLLKYEPSDDEKRAGIDEYNRKVGEYSTVKSLAKAYNQDPDMILQWKYAKVFGILYTDLEEHKFSKRYNKELEKKHAAKKR